MENTSERLEMALSSRPVKNPEKLRRQQSYYKRLSNNGVAKKETYNLKPLASI
jgi:hypothetical protein